MKKRGQRRIQNPVKHLGWIIFVKVKTTGTKFLQNGPCQMFERILNTTLINCIEVYLQKNCRCKSNAYSTLLKPCFGTFWLNTSENVLRKINNFSTLTSFLIYTYACLRILTRKKHPKIKLQRSRKIQIWTFGLLVLFKSSKTEMNFPKK